MEDDVNNIEQRSQSCSGGGHKKFAVSKNLLHSVSQCSENRNCVDTDQDPETDQETSHTR